MSIRVKIGAGESHIEHQQIEARLEALGLKLKPDHTIDEASASSVAGGLAAIQALARDGVIDADAIAKLRRQTHILGGLIGKDLPISEKESNAWRALALDLKGTAGTLSSINSEILSTGTIDNSLFHRAGARLEQLQKSVNKLSALKPDLARLAKVSPEVLRDVAAAGKELTSSATRFETTLSKFRSTMLEKLREANGPEFKVTPNGSGYDVQKRPGLWTRMQIDALAGSLSNALEAMPVFAQLGQAFSTPIGSPSLFPADTAPSTAKLTGAAQSILNVLGTDPSAFPGSVGPGSAERMPAEVRGAYRAVLRAAATDMVARREIADAYGHSTTAPKARTLEQTEATVPRPIFKAALTRAQRVLEQALAALGTGGRDASSVASKAGELLGKDAHYAAAVGALFEASSKTGPVRAGYGRNSI